MKAILGFTRMSVRGINKVKRELGFVLMTLNIRKVAARRAENNQKNYKKDNFYIISIEIVFFHLSRNFMSPTLWIYLFVFKRSRISVSNTVFVSISSSGSSFLIIVLAILTKINNAKATIIKSIID